MKGTGGRGKDGGGNSSGRSQAPCEGFTRMDFVHCAIMGDRTLRESCKVRQALELDKAKCACCLHGMPN